jgi:hypothetical protein
VTAAEIRELRDMIGTTRKLAEAVDADMATVFRWIKPDPNDPERQVPMHGRHKRKLEKVAQRMTEEGR